MNINQLFTNHADISLENYLKINGISNTKEYLNPTKKSIEPFGHYENMDKAVQKMEVMLRLDSRIYIVRDSDP